MSSRISAFPHFLPRFASSPTPPGADSNAEAAVEQGAGRRGAAGGGDLEVPDAGGGRSDAENLPFAELGLPY